MIAAEPPAPAGQAPRDAEHTTRTIEARAASSTRLRGAGVAVDVRRVGRVVGAVCLVALVVLAVALFVAGAQKNAQITRLRQHGVAVGVTVTGCLGLLGGSGSNAAGYECRGRFTLGGHRYVEDIPGNTIRTPGTTVRAVAVPGNPPLLSTARAVAIDRASARVFIAPAILIVVVVVVGAIALTRRHIRGARPPSLAGDGAR
jgi:hypothetical protein